MLPPGFVFYLVLVGSFATDMSDSEPEPTDEGVSFVPTTKASHQIDPVLKKHGKNSKTYLEISVNKNVYQNKDFIKYKKENSYPTLNEAFLNSNPDTINLWSKLEDFSLRQNGIIDKQQMYESTSQTIADESEITEKTNDVRNWRKKNKNDVSYLVLSEEENPFLKMLKLIDLNDRSKKIYHNLGHVNENAYPSNVIEIDGEEEKNLRNKENLKYINSKLNNVNSWHHEDDNKNQFGGLLKNMNDNGRSGKDATLTHQIRTTETLLIYPGSKARASMIERFRREVADPITIEGPCKTFADGDPGQQMFYSPGFPDNYPNKTDCVTVLKARQGQLIRLDFRDKFHIEPSDDCRFDYLEVRDGAHGYSPSIGHFCGDKFPNIVTSSGRYLWLHFRSDESIEYSGFTAVYDYIPKPTSSYYMPELEVCRMDMGGEEGYIRASDIDPERLKVTVDYGIPLDCMWVITVDKAKKIQLNFTHFALKKPNDCDSNFVDVFTNRTDIPSRLKNYCGSMADPVDSTSNMLHIRFMVEPNAVGSKFEASYTAFREREKDKDCNLDEYDCEDSTCISSALVCNGHPNCRFKWDEDDCNTDAVSSLMQSDHIVIILVVFSLILFGLSAAFVFKCVKKLISDHRTIQEHIRQSREGDIDEIGRAQTKILEPVSKILIKQDTCHSRGSRQLDAADCYVPGIGEILPIMLQGNQRERSSVEAVPHNTNNRDNEILVRQRSLQRQDAETQNQDDMSEKSGSEEHGNNDMTCSGNIPEMCDMSCQTRESLFQTSAFGHRDSSDGSFSPPPPSVDYSRKPTRDRDLQSSNSSARGPYNQTGSTPFSTFGYSGSTVQKADSRSPSGITRDPRYKAEAVIEMDRFGDESNGNFSDTDRNLDNRRNEQSQFTSEDRKNRNQTTENKLRSDSPSYHDRQAKRYQKDSHKPSDLYLGEQVKKHHDKRPYSVETTKSAPDVIIMTKSH